MSLVQVLPLAVVMVAGPQLLSAIFLSTSENWRRNVGAFLLGAGLAISGVVTAGYLLGDGVRAQGGSRGLLEGVVLALLVVAGVFVYRNRHEAEPPAWMGRLSQATPRFSFRLGLLLLGFFPTDLVTSVSVGAFLRANGLPLTDAAGFVGLTLLLLALPALAVLALGQRAEAALPKLRDWMNENAWVINEAVILFFVGMVLSG